MALDSKEIPLGGTETAFGLFLDVLKQARFGLLSIIPDKHMLAVWKKKPTRSMTKLVKKDGIKVANLPSMMAM